MQTFETPQSTTREWSGVHRTVCRLVGNASLLALSVACTGEIGGSGPGGSPMSSGGSGMSGAAGTTGTAGSGGTGVAPESANTVLRRLNKSEYNGTVRDLLGTSLRP